MASKRLTALTDAGILDALDNIEDGIVSSDDDKEIDNCEYESEKEDSDLDESDEDPVELEPEIDDSDKDKTYVEEDSNSSSDNDYYEFNRPCKKNRKALIKSTPSSSTDISMPGPSSSTDISMPDKAPYPNTEDDEATQSSTISPPDMEHPDMLLQRIIEHTSKNLKQEVITPPKPPKSPSSRSLSVSPCPLSPLPSPSLINAEGINDPATAVVSPTSLLSMRRSLKKS